MTKLSKIESKFDESGTEYKDCPHYHCEDIKCDGRIYVWERVKMTGSETEYSKPWASCTQSRHCNQIFSYKNSDWKKYET